MLLKLPTVSIQSLVFWPTFIIFSKSPQFWAFKWWNYIPICPVLQHISPWYWPHVSRFLGGLTAKSTRFASEIFYKHVLLASRANLTLGHLQATLNLQGRPKVLKPKIHELLPNWQKANNSNWTRGNFMVFGRVGY